MAKTKFSFESLPSVIGGLPVIQDPRKAIECLTIDKVPICRYEFGHSMLPILHSGQFCKIRPIDNDEISIGDAVFCDVDDYVGTHMVLMISKIDPTTTWYLIGMPDMTALGWTKKVYGIATAMDACVERPKFNTVPGGGKFFG